MEHSLDLILTLTAGLCVALLFALVMQKLRLSPLVGYLLAGLAIGPFTPGYVANQHLAEQFAEVGIILLMFGVGLHFHLKDLLAVKTIAISGALAQIAMAVGTTALALSFLDWSLPAGVVLGLAMSVASTVVLLRVLSENQALHTPTGHIAVGWLLVEDLFTVLVLVLMPSLWGKNRVPLGQLPLELGLLTGKLLLLGLFAWLAARYLIPRLLGYVARTRSRELFTLSVLALALGIAVGSAQLFGASMALGAFLAGMIVGQSPYAARATSDALPMRDAFAVLFFVSTGMRLQPAELMNDLGLIGLSLLIVLLVKPLVAYLILWLMKKPLSVSLPVALSLAQIGEFSFILGALGIQLEILPARASNVLVATAIVSIILNPFLYRWIPVLAQRVLGRPSSPAPETSAPGGSSSRHQAVVVGYGPVGRTLTRLLLENGIRPTVIELNPDTVKQLQELGIAAVYGDAAQGETLEHAGIAQAGSLFLTASVPLKEAAIQRAQELNPRIRIVARAAYLREAPALLEAGAHRIFSEEGEVALAMTDYLLRDLGASADQMDRERQHIYDELWGSSTSPA
ncbi:MAG: cation:proton antiporter [Candidatus Sericytochromatia bacterium]